VLWLGALERARLARGADAVRWGACVLGQSRAGACAWAGGRSGHGVEHLEERPDMQALD
jgi:hypothetical protein